MLPKQTKRMLVFTTCGVPRGCHIYFQHIASTNVVLWAFGISFCGNKATGRHTHIKVTKYQDILYVSRETLWFNIMLMKETIYYILEGNSVVKYYGYYKNYL